MQQERRSFEAEKEAQHAGTLVEVLIRAVYGSSGMLSTYRRRLRGQQLLPSIKQFKYIANTQKKLTWKRGSTFP